MFFFEIKIKDRIKRAIWKTFKRIKFYKPISQDEYIKKHNIKYKIALEKEIYSIPKRIFFSQNLKKSYFNKEDSKLYDSPEVKILELKNSIAIPKSDFILSKKYLIHPDKYFHGKFILDIEKNRTLKFVNNKSYLLKKQKLVLENAVSLLGFTNGNWCHLIVENLPKMILIDNFPEFDNYPFLIESNLSGHLYANTQDNFSKILKKFNLKNRKIIEIDGSKGGVLVKNLIYFTSINHYMHKTPVDFKNFFENSYLTNQLDHLHLNSIKLIPDFFKKFAYNDDCAKEEKIYLSRNLSKSYNKERGISNISQIELILKKNNFKLIDPLNYELEELFDIINSSKIIVSQTSAHLSNLIFCKPTKLVLLSRVVDKNHAFFHNYFYNIFSYLGFKTSLVLGLAESSSDHSNFKIEVQDLLECLANEGCIESKSKKVALIGSSFTALPLLFILKKRGFLVTVFGSDASDPCHEYSDNSIYIDYSNKDSLLESLKNEEFEFIVPSCNDYSYISASWAAEIIGFKGFDSFEKTMLLHTKKTFRKYLQDNNFSSPAFIDLEDYKNQENKIPFPVIVKPNDSFSGIGVNIANNLLELFEFIKIATKNSRTSEYILEEFVAGTLHSHTAFIEEGSIFWDEFADEFCNTHPYQVGKSNHPSSLKSKIKDNVRKEISRLISDLELTDGLLHTQIIVNKDKFWIIETMRRSPGDLYGIAIEKSVNFKYYDFYVRKFINEKYNIDNKIDKIQSNITREIIFSKKSLTLFSLKMNFDSNINNADIEFFPLKKGGQFLKKATLDKMGILFTKK